MPAAFTLADLDDQIVQAVSLMGFTIETTKKKESGREYESGYLCRRCFDSIMEYLALQEALESIKKDLQSKISLHLRSCDIDTTITSEKRGTK